MGYIVKMPKMGLEMEQGQVVSWDVSEGERVEEGEIIAVVESEKTTNDVEARADGAVREILVPAGEAVEPGTPIAIFGGPDEDIAGLRDSIESPATGGQEPAAAAGDGAATSEGPPVDAGTSGPDAASGGDAGTDAGASSASDVRATPGARTLADEAGVDLTAVAGTGPQGTVTEDDVRAELSAGDEATGGAASTGEGDSQERATTEGAPSGHDPDRADVRATPGARARAEEVSVDLTSIDGTGPQGVITADDVERAAEGGSAGATRTVAEVRELTAMQQTVSDRLSESYRNAVHVTLQRSVDASVLRTVDEAADRSGLDVSLTDLLVCGLGATLADRPALNALYRDGEQQVIEEVNIGVAVDVDRGLVTPVIPSVPEQSVEAVASRRRELTERAQSGRFDQAAMAGGTCTVTNLGMFGVDRFDPIINPPQVAILSVGRIRDDGELTLGLTVDHRVVNGADGARFLDDLVGRLTDPATMVGFFDADLAGAFGAMVVEE